MEKLKSATSDRKDSRAGLPPLMASERSHRSIALGTTERLQQVLEQRQVAIDGETIDVAGVVAVARHGVKPHLDESQYCLQRIDDSVKLLQDQLDRGDTVYGVNTGFGGSADSRSSKLADVQVALLQHHNFGILSKSDKASQAHRSHSTEDRNASTAMPSEWVRASMLVRANSVVRGHSAVTIQVIRSLVKLLQNDFIPVVPLRGSISASGDLSPLSYIAGAITGNPDIYIRTPNGETLPSDKALQMLDIQPIALGPKEGLGLMNGTAMSAALASLTIHDANNLTCVAQILTSMSVEALAGTADSFDPFIARIRPHRGQIEVSKNIRSFLQGSRLTKDHQVLAKRPLSDLYQDRYALRTAAQWIGPQVEDLSLAFEQISVELNSTTDNPLIDSAGDRILHGGNFQAASITSAMEKTRLSLQMLGKLMFSQTSELINPSLNHGLASNLSPDEPSTSFLMKGIDIGMAAYMSELGFLANPVSSHVQSAEMHNQAVNSLAFISARYTREAAQIVAMMAASHLCIVCQALDLRVMQMEFFDTLAPEMDKLFDELFAFMLRSEQREQWKSSLWMKLVSTWSSLAVKDSPARAEAAARAGTGELASGLVNQIAPEHAGQAFKSIGAWGRRTQELMQHTFISTRNRFFQHQTTSSYLGEGSKAMYNHVRQTLGVQFHRGLEDDPTYQGGEPGRTKLTVGSWISKIYESFQSGELHTVIMTCCQKVEQTAPTNGHA